ncbi:alpha/beta fold hydrolase [Halomonas litopenaei]|uniref:alpha/beta fold hydrolase n=1 Tax=Halomonas litopenaei TaxID=2109328 RepID=UPI001A8CE725|nr:alpha/beta hydrolase [Halomonas litopenaei]MBN8413617.1 alpha/beta hydrolase [Halomonas litopenaei]
MLNSDAPVSPQTFHRQRMTIPLHQGLDTLASSAESAGLEVARWHPGSDTTGVPLVLMHDSLGSIALWRDFPERLCRQTGREVIAYDRLGFGQSSAHPGQLPHSFVTDEAHQGFAAVHRALGLEGFILVGHSVGGAMAAAIAARYRDCHGLITMAAQAFVEPRTLAGIGEARDAFARPGQMERLEKYHGAKARWVLDAWVDTWLDPDFRGWTLDDRLAQITCPVLVLHGDQDEYGSEAQPRRYAELPAGPCQMQILKECGHVPHREQPDRVLEIITSFVNESR